MMNLLSSLRKRATVIESKDYAASNQHKAAGLFEAIGKIDEIERLEKQLASLRSEAGSMCYNWEYEWNDERRKLYDDNKQDTARLQAYLEVKIKEFENGL